MDKLSTRGKEIAGTLQDNSLSREMRRFQRPHRYSSFSFTSVSSCPRTQESKYFIIESFHFAPSKREIEKFLKKSEQPSTSGTSCSDGTEPKPKEKDFKAGIV